MQTIKNRSRRNRRLFSFQEDDLHLADIHRNFFTENFVHIDAGILSMQVLHFVVLFSVLFFVVAKLTLWLPNFTDELNDVQISGLKRLLQCIFLRESFLVGLVLLNKFLIYNRG